MAKTKTRKYTPKGTYTSTPMFSMTKEQHQAIIDSINIAFARMKAGNFTQREWVDVLTRMYVGKHMLESFYEESCAVEFAPCLVACQLIEERAALHNHEKWDMTEAEAYFLELGLDTVERIQMESLRRDFLLAHRFADMQITKAYIKSRKGIEKGLV